MSWIEACAADDIEAEDVTRFDHGGRTFAIYRSPDDEYYATDGLCTHEQAHLADGLVMDNIIECPKHNGRFDYRSGEAKRAPACVNLRTYPVRVENGKILIDIGGYCAWAVSQGYTAKIDPEAWRIVDGKPYLNYSKDVQAQWAEDISGNITKGDANWPKIRADLAG